MDAWTVIRKDMNGFQPLSGKPEEQRCVCVRYKDRRVHVQVIFIMLYMHHTRN